MDPDQMTADTLQALEARRCAATAAGDTAALAEIYAPGMIFVHRRGKTQSREDYIAEVAVKPRSFEYGPMSITMFGDMAIMTGNQDITRTGDNGEKRTTNTFATRVLQKSGSDWRYVFIQVASMVI